MRMPFGKFKGYKIDEIPDHYLRWLLFDADFIDEELLASVQHECEARWPGRMPVKVIRIQQKNETSSYPLNFVRKKIKDTYRKLALRFHPDRIGGDKAAMQVLNLFYEELEGI